MLVEFERWAGSQQQGGVEGRGSGAGMERGRSEVGAGWEMDAAAFGSLTEVRESAAGWELVSEVDGASLPRVQVKQQTDVWCVELCCRDHAGLTDGSSELEVEMEGKM